MKAISTTPVANPQSSGVVVYEVKIGFASPPPPEVRLGMSATVDIITSERKDALLAPSRAIKEDEQGNTQVDILVNKKTQTRQVKTGLSDGINTEILNGLDEAAIRWLSNVRPKTWACSANDRAERYYQDLSYGQGRRPCPEGR